MGRDIAIAFAAIAAFALLFWLLERWACARQAKKLREQWKLNKAKEWHARQMADRALSEPIPWDDGLDVSKLHVKHEPTGE